MPVPSAFHSRTHALCESLNYRDWSGFYAVGAFEAHHEHEYNAIRNGCALIDISPLFKYRITGPDATPLVNRVITRDATQLAIGQVYYTPWCDEDGHVIDDGTVARVAEHAYRWTAADPSLRWLTYNLFVHLLKRFGVPRVLVRYESLVSSPSHQLQRIVEAAGETLGPGDLSFLDIETVELGVHHTVAGNPMRFSRGRIPLRLDEEWKTKLEKRQQRLISLLTWPLMWRYGYLRRRFPKR